MTRTKLLICPYCGEAQPVGERCRACGGFFDPLSRQATHNAMGPWFVRDPDRPHRPGCSYETLVQMIERGQVTKYSIIRGPTTRQFWTVARHVPGAAHLLGYCHACDGPVDPDEHGCPHCGVPFGAYLDRNYLGVPDVEAGEWDAGDADRTGAPAARGLSSFAADEELLDPRARTTAGGERRGWDGDGRRRNTPEDRPPSDAPSAEEWIASPAVRSMQRRLAGQQRAIRLLIALLIIVIVGSIVFSLTMAASLRSGASDRAPAESARQTTLPPGDGAAPQASGAESGADEGASGAGGEE
ncbi:MAG: hypothetical protein SYC29_04105 [Planctomycetota bacterium]|nr:hypothetical protein [Planctomycetota bacterium]